jgi:hypothetical protein
VYGKSGPESAAKLLILVVDGKHLVLILAPKDGTPVASGEYARILFFPLWKGGGFKDAAVTTTYVDNITAIAELL